MNLNNSILLLFFIVKKIESIMKKLSLILLTLLTLQSFSAYAHNKTPFLSNDEYSILMANTIIAGGMIFLFTFFYYMDLHRPEPLKQQVCCPNCKKFFRIRGSRFEDTDPKVIVINHYVEKIQYKKSKSPNIYRYDPFYTTEYDCY
jgi:hypothetical protein